MTELSAPEFDFSAIRWVGVLPRIAFVFLACALIFLNTNWKQQIKIGTIILVLYWIVEAYIPVPGIGKPDLSVKDENKRLVLPRWDLTRVLLPCSMR